MVILVSVVKAETGNNSVLNSTVALLVSKDQDNDKNITNVKAAYNPVAEQLSISFKLGKQSSVSVKLMDALGNEVQHLSNSVLEAGNQSLSFDKDNKVEPGFYFIKVSSGSEAVVKRVSIR